MWAQIIAGAFLTGIYVYHRWFEETDYESPPLKDSMIPRTDQGTPISLIYGRVRQERPVLAWGMVHSIVSTDQPLCRYLFVIGIGMGDGSAQSKVCAWFHGNTRFPDAFNDLDYTGPNSLQGAAFTFDPQGTYVEQLLGSSTQVLANAGETEFNAATHAGRSMIHAGVPISDIPGYRGYICAFLQNFVSGFNIVLNPERMSFEVESFPASGVGAIGQDCNPADVLKDLIVYRFGKLGLTSAAIDSTSFASAWSTLKSESHGYSRIIDAAEAEQHIRELLEQIDGVLRENPRTGLLELKLVRNDYDPLTVPHISKANCSAIENLAIGGWQGVPNKISVVFPERANGYREGRAFAHNQANAVGQDGIVREQTLRMNGVCYQSLADAIAARELAARSRPITKCRAICDRTMRDLMPGDAVKLTWSDPDIAGAIFRVADIDRGTPADGKVAVDLISDYFYVWRNQAPQPIGIGNGRAGQPIILMG
jgi:hypothetical protein